MVNYGSSGLAAGIGLVLVLLSIAGSVALHFTFLSPKNEDKFEGFLGWLYSFLSFKKLIIEDLLKIIYLFTAFIITLFGLLTITTSFIACLVTIVFGNIFTRVTYEFILLTILICKNVTEINSKLSNK